MTDERRRTARVACEWRSSYRDIDKPGDRTAYFALVQDISAEGAKLQVPKLIPINNRIVLHLELPNRPSFEVKAKPSWFAELPALDSYNVGVRFLDISEESRGFLLDFCQTQRPG